MLQMKVKKEDLSNIFIPVGFKEAMIFALELKTEDTHKGLYGMYENKLVFFPYDELPDIIDIQVPESVEEVAVYPQIAEYVGQRLMCTDNIFVEGFGTVDFKYAVRPFVEFLKRYEERVQIIERIKHGNY